MFQIRIAAVLATLLWLVGCAAPQQAAVPLAADYYKARTDKIAVAMTELPKADTSFPGADCLLCIAFASAANSALTKAVQAWSTNELKPLPGDLAASLRSKSQPVSLIAEPLKLADFPDRKDNEPGSANKDFSKLKASQGVDRLLVVQVHALGAWRNYSAYIPSGAPRAVLKAQAFIVDLTTQKYDWYQEFDLAQPAEGNWDEPPAFAGMTNAYFQVLENFKDQIKKAVTP